MKKFTNKNQLGVFFTSDFLGIKRVVHNLTKVSIMTHVYELF